MNDINLAANKVENPKFLSGQIIRWHKGYSHRLVLKDPRNFLFTPDQPGYLLLAIGDDDPYPEDPKKKWKMVGLN